MWTNCCAACDKGSILLNYAMFIYYASQLSNELIFLPYTASLSWNFCLSLVDGYTISEREVRFLLEEKFPPPP